MSVAGGGVLRQQENEAVLTLGFTTNRDLLLHWWDSKGVTKHP